MDFLMDKIMNQENNISQFAMDKPEKTEFERIQERLQNAYVPISPQEAQVTQTILEMGLKKGVFGLSDIAAVNQINVKIAQGLNDHSQMVNTMQKRMMELNEEELVKKQQEIAQREQAQQQKLTDERLLRKRMEDRIKTLEAQIATLGQAPIATIGEEKVDVQKFTPPSFDKDATTVTVDKVDSTPKPKSRAWEMVRAMNPVTSEDIVEIPKTNIAPQPHIDDAYDADLSHTIKPQPKDDPDLVEAVTPTPEEQVEEQITDLGEDLPSAIPQHRLKATHYMEDTFEELEASQESDFTDFKLVEDDQKTTPTFSGPKITATNMQPKEESGFTIGGKPVKVYEDLEDVEKAMEEKKAALSEEVEEEYEEIVIPSEGDLRSMTKKEIESQAAILGFETVSTSSTKEVMIENFLSETESYIKQLQDDGEFVSATEQNEDEDSSSNPDIRDGGFF
jgi:hypothetical protein